MADQAQQTAKGAGEKTQNAPGAGGVQKGVEGATSGILGTIEGWGNWIAGKGKEVMDRVIPPEQRASILAKLQEFMLKNPKLSVSLFYFFPPLLNLLFFFFLLLFPLFLL